MARKRQGAEVAPLILTDAEILEAWHGIDENWTMRGAVLDAIRELPLERCPLNGLVCSVCEKPQRRTFHGVTCGEHGGADGIAPEPTPTPSLRELTGKRVGPLTAAEIEERDRDMADLVGAPYDAADEKRMSLSKVARGVRIETIIRDTTRLVQIDGDINDHDHEPEVDVRGAIVKYAPTIRADARDSLDLSGVSDYLKSRGAIAVVFAPKVIRSETNDRVAAAIAKAPSPEDAVRAWFAELAGVPDDEREEALELALSLLAEELAS